MVLDGLLALPSLNSTCILRFDMVFIPAVDFIGVSLLSFGFHNVIDL